MEITILEGARGTGKSTLAFKLRQKIPETTLINFTGFHTDGEDGLCKVSDYYKSWMKLFYDLRYHESNFVFDRFYFSESIFSKLYKSYDFENEFYELSDLLYDLSDYGVKINIFNLTINDTEELRHRLMRDKVPFGKAKESVEESLKQQELYDSMFENFNHYYSDTNLNTHTIDTSGKTNDNVYDEIVKKIKTTF